MSSNQTDQHTTSSTQQVMGAMVGVLGKVAPAGSPQRRAGGKLLQGLLHRKRARSTRKRNLNPPFSFPHHQTPLVSIVVPIHGKWDYTYRCLEALANTESEHTFEVVLVDDKSPDQSRTFAQRVDGLEVVALDINRGYVGACNAGIERARGEYVVLLNNDTRVMPDWLDPLVETLRLEGVGLVGARLIYPDGVLQDAGGIVFKDGSGWNYGKRQVAENHAFTYLRDPDYVSGACTIIRRDTLNTLGGLDELFAPAYYDDTDLAFAVREMGMRVVYEPRSVVIHDEGVSHGTDETQGVKAYQVVNKEKFVEKWAHRLADHFDNDPTIVEYAARRRNGEQIVIVIDDIVPRPDQDSGSVRRYASLIALKELGYGVIFVPHDRARTEPYCSNLTKQGIEVFYGVDSLADLVTSLDPHLAAIIVSRLPVATATIPLVRTIAPSVPIIFDTVDLHFLREERSSELNEGAHTDHPTYIRELELATIRTADATVVVSPFEQKLLNELTPNVPVHVVSNVHDLPDIGPGADERDGVIFVGSFSHDPNVDAVNWLFEEILPLLETTNPGLPITIVGKNPPAEIVEKAPTNVTFTGWVEDLAPLYSKAALAIAPLRYGAGVKGKVGEAMSYGLPVVMTTVGAEGMGIKHRETAWVADDAEGFAQGVSTLLADGKLWAQLRKNGPQHIDTTFGAAVFSRGLQELLDSVKRP